jgi:hypothetical protein
MHTNLNKQVLATFLWLMLAALVPIATSQEAAAPTMIKIGSSLTMTAPAGWLSKAPRSKIIEYEFSIPAVEGDERDGRATMMGAGGSVEANIDRWIGQFKQPEGSESKPKGTTKEQQVAGQTVHILDITGTYQDKPRGPFGPSTDKPDYRMLGAVIVTKDSGSYFVKLYGPRKTIAANEASFFALIDSLQSAD